MKLPPVDCDYLVDFLVGILNTPGPIGMTELGVLYTEKALESFSELQFHQNRKGAL